MPWLCKYAHFSSDFLHFDKSLLLLTVTLRGVSNKHCLLSLFSFITSFAYFLDKFWSNDLDLSSRKVKVI